MFSDSIFTTTSVSTSRSYDRLVSKIQATVHLIWEDMEVPFTWSRFLDTAVVGPASDSKPYDEITWGDFITGTSRDPRKETALRETRRENQQHFDQVLSL